MIERAGSRVLGVVLLLAAGPALGEGPVPRYEYQAAWVAVASAEPVTVEVDDRSPGSLVRLRPARAFALQAPLVEAGKSRPRLAAGTVMVGMKDAPGTACRLDRPQFEYFVECVEDADGDGRYEGYFILNHENPFLFSARRQPRHQKVSPTIPLGLDEVAAEQAPTLAMVLLYPQRSAMLAASGTHRFQLCVMRPNVKNLWGDRTVGRGCLPDIVVRDGEFPRTVQIYGRTLTIMAPANGKVVASATASAADLPVDL